MNQINQLPKKLQEEIAVSMENALNHADFLDRIFGVPVDHSDIMRNFPKKPLTVEEFMVGE